MKQLKPAYKQVLARIRAFLRTKEGGYFATLISAMIIAMFSFGMDTSHENTVRKEDRKDLVRDDIYKYIDAADVKTIQQIQYLFDKHIEQEKIYFNSLEGKIDNNTQNVRMMLELMKMQYGVKDGQLSGNSNYARVQKEK